jgi:hypothetical protein
MISRWLRDDEDELMKKIDEVLDDVVYRDASFNASPATRDF